jgi:hypothetical protein
MGILFRNVVAIFLLMPAVLQMFGSLVQASDSKPEALHRGDQISTVEKEKALPVASIDALFKKHGKGFSQEVVLKGRIEKVCQSKGCWFTVTGDQKDAVTIRITSKGYLFFVPKDIARQQAYVKGVLSNKALSPEEAQHYLDDEAKAAGKPTPAKSSVPLPTSEWRMEATGVEWHI